MTMGNEKQRIVRVDIPDGWVSFFVRDLYAGGTIDIRGVLEAWDEPCLLTANDDEVVDFDEFDEWADRACDCTSMPMGVIKAAVWAVLEGYSDAITIATSKGSREPEKVTVGIRDYMLSFSGELIEDVKKANGGRFLNLREYGVWEGRKGVSKEA